MIMDRQTFPVRPVFKCAESFGMESEIALPMGIRTGFWRIQLNQFDTLPVG